MYQLTEVYSENLDSEKQRKTRLILVNPAQVTFIRESGSMRRIYFVAGGEGSDYVDVVEPLMHLAAYLVPVAAGQR